MLMKAQQLRAKAGIVTETASYTNEATYDGTGSVEYEIAKMTVEPTMCIKAQQLSAETGIVTEFQVAQNKELTVTRVGQSATQKRS
jgi:hypothetical protein